MDDRAGLAMLITWVILGGWAILGWIASLVIARRMNLLEEYGCWLGCPLLLILFFLVAPLLGPLCFLGLILKPAAKKKTCPWCEARIPVDAQICPNCRAEVT